MEALWGQFMEVMGGRLFNIIAALSVLIIGWLAAIALTTIVRATLHRLAVGKRVSKWMADAGEDSGMQTEKWITKGVYYLLMLFVLVAFFQTLGLTLITEPLNQILVHLFNFAPRLLSASLLLLFAWILARVLRFVVQGLLSAFKIDERLGESTGLKRQKEHLVSQSVGNAVYWLIFLIFLPAILDALALEGLLLPVQEMLGEVIGFLPNLFASALILVIGWFLARVVQRVVTNLLSATGLDRAGEASGLKSVLGKQKLSVIVGFVVYVLILLPVVITALDALQFEAISKPASAMLQTIFNAIPAIFTAVLVMLVAYLVGRFLSGLVSNLLTQLRFDTVLVRLGLEREEKQGGRTPSEVVGFLVLVAVLIFALIEATDLLGFGALAELLVQFTTFAGHLLLGLIIFGFGLFLANLVSGVIRERTSGEEELLAVAARVAIVVMALAMGLRQMGLANEIIQIAFGVLFGAIGVAVALAFGLGSRDVAGRQVEKWLSRFKGKNE